MNYLGKRVGLGRKVIKVYRYEDEAPSCPARVLITEDRLVFEANEELWKAGESIWLDELPPWISIHDRKRVLRYLGRSV